MVFYEKLNKRENKCKICGADTYIGKSGSEIHSKYLDENWEKEFDKWFYSENSVYSDKYITRGFNYKGGKDFIYQLLKTEKEKWDKDHEILINTILDTKNKEIKEKRSGELTNLKI